MVKYCKFLKLLSLGLIAIMMFATGCGKFGDGNEETVDAKKVAEELFQTDFKNLTDEKLKENLNTYTKKEVNDELAKMDQENKYFNNLLNNPSRDMAMLMKAYLGSCEKQKVEKLIGDAVKHLCSQTEKAEERALMLGAMFNFGADPKEFKKKDKLAPDMLTRAMEMVAEENSDKFYDSLDDNGKKEWTEFMIHNSNEKTPILAFKTIYKNSSDGDKESLHNALLTKVYDEKDHKFLEKMAEFGVNFEGNFKLSNKYKGSLLFVLMAREMEKDGYPEGVKALAGIFKEKLGDKYEGQVSDDIIDRVSKDEDVPGLALHRLNCPSKVKPKHVMECAKAIQQNNDPIRKDDNMTVLHWLFASAITDKDKASELNNKKIGDEIILLSEAIMQFGTKAHMTLLWDALDNGHIAYIAIALKDKIFIKDGNTIMPAYFQAYYLNQGDPDKYEIKNYLVEAAFKSNLLIDIIQKQDYLPLDDLKGQDYDIDDKGNKGTLLHSMVVLLSLRGSLEEQAVKPIAQALKDKGGFSAEEWQAYNKVLLATGIAKEWLLIE